MASQRQQLNSLGSSAKGQFIALEEYGYHAEKHTYYVTVRFINLWTSEDVGQQIEVETPAANPSYLQKARSRAKELARDQMAKFNIISG